MHRINRVELELHTGDVALAQALSARVSRLHERRMVPTIERVCDELDREAAVRIEDLEVDLGTLTVASLDDFDDRLIAALADRLRAALAAALEHLADEAPGHAALELLETFALTGGLPWWAPRDADVVARSAAQAAAAAQPELAALIDGLRGARSGDHAGGFAGDPVA